MLFFISEKSRGNPSFLTLTRFTCNLISPFFPPSISFGLWLSILLTHKNVLISLVNLINLSTSLSHSFFHIALVLRGLLINVLATFSEKSTICVMYVSPAHIINGILNVVKIDWFEFPNGGLQVLVGFCLGTLRPRKYESWAVTFPNEMKKIFI